MSKSLSHPYFVLLVLAILFCAAPALAGEKDPLGNLAEDVPQPAICFAPDTPDDYASEITRRYGNSTPPLFKSGGLANFQLTNRWSATATNGGGLIQGDPTTITWSYIPDGTFISGFAGEPPSNSNLFAWLNGIYGSFNTWHALFVQVFDRWGELTGNTYVYQPTDDGAIFPNAAGLLGVRGDVRIGGHFIDGTSGILAYNFFPNFGDMVIDSADGFYNVLTNNSLRLRNVLAHEHGHGMGMSHVCPINQTKLMEPFFSAAFDGPQFDDILGAQRHYGDFFEHNDTSGTATSFGYLPSGTNGFEDELSVDDNSDQNYYTFTTDPGQQASVTIAPPSVAPYLSGPQNPNGSCSPGTLFDPTNIHDLGVELIDSDGTTVLASANANPAGGSETLTNVTLPSGAGPYYVRVFGDTTNNIQAYELTLDVTAVPGCTLRNGKTYGKWNLPPAGGSAVGVSGILDFNGTNLYSLLATLTETSPTTGTVVGTLSDGTLPNPDYDVVGTYLITTPATATTPAYGTWKADIFTVGTTNLVGKIAGNWKDFTPTNNIGKYEGEWKICD